MGDIKTAAPAPLAPGEGVDMAGIERAAVVAGMASVEGATAAQNPAVEAGTPATPNPAAQEGPGPVESLDPADRLTALQDARADILQRMREEKARLGHDLPDGRGGTTAHDLVRELRRNTRETNMLQDQMFGRDEAGDDYAGGNHPYWAAGNRGGPSSSY